MFSAATVQAEQAHGAMSLSASSKVSQMTKMLALTLSGFLFVKEPM